ncbi:MAG: class I SAM-dependent methyltransferase [Patescibacteria group bacterium]|jgi:SAM-dependent methyltransferase
MQNDAEKYLIKLLKKILKLVSGKSKIINLGAAQSVVIEEELIQDGINFVCDRSDIQPNTVSKEYIGQSFICPLEKMTAINSNEYDCVFANFVLEHISDPLAAASEITRILKPGGKLIISLSNPRAPEFRLARITPTSFHQLLREKGHDPAYPVKYAYGSIEKLIKLFENNGLKLQEDRRFPAIYSYLYHFPILNFLGKTYDKILKKLKWRGIMGHCVLFLEK